MPPRTKIRIRINSDGTMLAVDKAAIPLLRRAGTVALKRASHVLPKQWLARQVFRVLRSIFGDQGWVATFTRAWPCSWLVDLAPSNGPILGPYNDRQVAIDMEIKWLEDNLVTVKYPVAVRKYLPSMECR